MSKFEMDMCSGPLFKKLVRYALPLLLTNVLQLTFNMADIIVLGKFVSNDAVAAVGATSSLINLIIGLFVGLSVGANVLIARCVGSNDQERAHKIVGMSVLISLIIGVFLAVVGVIFAKTFLLWMNCDLDVIDMSTKYMRIYFLGMPVVMLYNFCASIMRAVGDTVRPLVYLIIGGVANVGLNLLFVLVFHKDVEGVAIATVSSQLISSVLAIVALSRSDGFAKLKWKHVKIYKSELADMARIGLPAGLQGCVFSLSNVVIQSTVNSFGKVVMAGNTIASQLEGFIYNATNAVSLSAMAFVSQNVGAGNYARIRKIMWESLLLATIVSTVMGGIVLLCRVPLCNLFIRSDQDPRALEYACLRLYIIASTYFTCGLMDAMSNVMRGLGKSALAMIVSLSGSCLFRILWVYTMCRWYRSLQTLYWVYPISWILTFAIFMFIYFPTVKRDERRAELQRLAEEEADAELSPSDDQLPQSQQA